MSRQTPIPWNSVTLLPPLIGVSGLVAVVIALLEDMSLHLGTVVVLCALAVAGIAYPSFLIRASRRQAAGLASVAPKS